MKVAGIVVIIAGALVVGARTGHIAASVTSTHTAAAISASSFGVALIACLLAYDGWVQLSYVAGEIRNPQRNVVWALSWGTLAVAAVYLLANFAYMRALSIPEIAASEHVGADTSARVFGAPGGAIVSLIILFSVLGTLNGCFLTSPRVYFAQASDGLFFRKFAEIHRSYGTPGFAIVAQAIWSAVLVVTGTYESLVDYALFGNWLLYGLMIASVIILRRTRPEVPRPYRMWGYPVTPVIFLAITLWFLVNTLATRPISAFASLGLMLTGLPAYWSWRRYTRHGAMARPGPAEG